MSVITKTSARSNARKSQNGDSGTDEQDVVDF